MVRPPPNSFATLATSFLERTMSSPKRWASSAVQRFVRAICVPSLPWAAEALAATAPALFWALAGKGQTCSQSSAACACNVREVLIVLFVYAAETRREES